MQGMGTEGLVAGLLLVRDVHAKARFLRRQPAGARALDDIVWSSTWWRGSLTFLMMPIEGAMTMGQTNAVLTRAH